MHLVKKIEIIANSFELAKILESLDKSGGNIVPPYGAANGGEGASIEYAINRL
jgi:nitrogen regulatory protein PII